MKLGKLIVEIRRVGSPKLAEEIFDFIIDPEGEIRKVIAKMARSAAKDFVTVYGEKIIEEFTVEMEKRKDAILAELGSAAPTDDPVSGSGVAAKVLKYTSGSYNWAVGPSEEGED